MSMNNTVFLDLLVQKSILSPVDAERLSEKYNGNAFSILQHLLEGGVVKKDIIGKLWGDSLGFSYVNLDKSLFQTHIVNQLPEDFARKNKIIPLYEIHNVVTVAIFDPLNTQILEQTRYLMKKEISPVFSFEDEIFDSIDIQYQSTNSLNEFISRIANHAIFKETRKITAEELDRFSGDRSIIDFTRSLLLLCVKERASDIHIDPQDDMIYVRIRIDGVLHTRLKLEKILINPLSSRLKVMADLNITERRRPQDGRVRVQLTNKSLDFRLSSTPTIYGEKLVLRALGRIEDEKIPEISDLGFLNNNYQAIETVTKHPNGIFFVTGPTGSGKSTTLFSVLQRLNKPEINIMTIEDPVEYRLPGINQVQVNNSIGFDFSRAIRSFMRQDPDVMLIGEVRDYETAKIASEAALTGHLVLTTMHTNSALQALTRLIQIGVEPFLVAPSILGVMAQRLVRKICPNCKEKYQVTHEFLERYFFNINKHKTVFFYKGSGCVDCNGRGYLGRVAIHEIFIITNNIRELIAKGASNSDIEKEAKKTGFKSMRHDGLKKVLLGQTTIEEVNRVTAGI